MITGQWSIFVFFSFDLTLEFFLPVIRIFWSDGGSLLMTKVDIMQRVFPVRAKSMNTLSSVFLTRVFTRCNCCCILWVSSFKWLGFSRNKKRNLFSFQCGFNVTIGWENDFIIFDDFLYCWRRYCYELSNMYIILNLFSHCWTNIDKLLTRNVDTILTLLGNL